MEKQLEIKHLKKKVDTLIVGFIFKLFAKMTFILEIINRQKEILKILIYKYFFLNLTSNKKIMIDQLFLTKLFKCFKMECYKAFEFS